MTVDAPTDLQLDGLVDQLATLAGPLGALVADRVRDGIQHLRDEADSLWAVAGQQHEELLARDHTEALGSPVDQWGRAALTAGPVGRSTDADGSNHAGF